MFSFNPFSNLEFDIEHPKDVNLQKEKNPKTEEYFVVRKSLF